MIGSTEGPWSLPGPSRAVAELCDALYRNRVIAVRAPLGVSALGKAVQRRLNDDGQVHVLIVEADANQSIVTTIAKYVGITASSPAALITAPELANCAVIVEAMSGNLGGSDEVALPDHTLDDMARLASHATSGSEPLILVIGDGRLSPVAGKRPREMRGVVGPLDAAARLAQHAVGLAPFEHRLVASVAMETAGWDIDLLDKLAALPIVHAVRPDYCVEAWSDSRRDIWAGKSANWTTGSIDTWAGELCEHPLWLAINQPAGLTKRIWSGQVAVLLPWIETRRLEMIAKFCKKLRPDPVRSGPDIEALDWGPLRSQLQGEPAGLIDFLDAHRLARNELAHGRPLGWPEIAKCLSHTRR